MINVINWFVSVSLVLVGIILLPTIPLPCLFLILIGILLAPPSPIRKRIGRWHKKYKVALLAATFGFMGAHKFYLHKTHQGLLYFGLMFTGIGMVIFYIISLFEAVAYILMSKEEFEKRYL
jgi:TM2 domain-containing membrane protein YozV